MSNVVILAANEWDYVQHIKRYTNDKFGRYLQDIFSLRGVRDIDAVIRTEDWASNRAYDELFLAELEKRRKRAPMRILFVGSDNKVRTRTAQEIFEIMYPQYEFKSCGINSRDVVQTRKWYWNRADFIHEELLEWADVIYAMEPLHRDYIFKRTMKAYPVLTLGIDETHEYYSPKLINILKDKVNLG